MKPNVGSLVSLCRDWLVVVLEARSVCDCAAGHGLYAGKAEVGATSTVGLITSVTPLDPPGDSEVDAIGWSACAGPGVEQQHRSARAKQRSPSKRPRACPGSWTLASRKRRVRDALCEATVIDRRARLMSSPTSGRRLRQRRTIRFARPDIAELTIELATIQHSDGASATLRFATKGLAGS